MPNNLKDPLPLAVCAAVIYHQGKILLTQRPDGKPHAGLWEFPGGKIDAGESPHQSLCRELREELNIEISVGPILETVYHHYPWGAVLIFAYRCRWMSGKVEHLEVAAHRWLQPEQLNEYQILPADQPIIARILATAEAEKNRLSSLPKNK